MDLGDSPAHEAQPKARMCGRRAVTPAALGLVVFVFAANAASWFPRRRRGWSDSVGMRVRLVVGHTWDGAGSFAFSPSRAGRERCAGISLFTFQGWSTQQSPPEG